jgi:hypothetical protein
MPARQKKVINPETQREINEGGAMYKALQKKGYFGGAQPQAKRGRKAAPKPTLPQFANSTLPPQRGVLPQSVLPQSFLKQSVLPQTHVKAAAGTGRIKPGDTRERIMNPHSNQMIIRGGQTHKKLIKEGKMPAEPTSPKNQGPCTPKIKNPVTQRMITYGGQRYLQLVRDGAYKNKRQRIVDPCGKMVLNPETQRMIKEGSYTHKDLIKRGLLTGAATGAAPSAGKVINPDTLREIGIGSYTYKKLVKEGKLTDESGKTAATHLGGPVSPKIINPDTMRPIKPGGHKHNELIATGRLKM